MTTPLSAGTLIVSPADVGLLAVLVREGVIAVGARRSLPRRVGPLLAAVEAAAATARSEAGTGVRTAPVGPARSTATVAEAAEVLKVSEVVVRRRCRDGSLVAERRGLAWMIDSDSLASYALARREVA